MCRKCESDAFAKVLYAFTQGHRGIIAELLSIVSRKACKTLHSCVQVTNNVVCSGDGIQCRAVKPNGRFEALLLQSSEVKDALVQLLWKGDFIVESPISPINTLVTLGVCVLSDGNEIQTGAILVISNPHLVRWLHNQFPLLKPAVHQPQTVHNYLLLGLAYFDMRDIFQSAEGTPCWTMRNPPHPYEDQYGSGVVDGVEFATREKAQTGFCPNKIDGKPDA